MHSGMAWCFRPIGAVLVRRLSISVVALLCATLPAVAQPEMSKTASHVKVQATADKPNEAGQQEVTILLEIDERYYLIGDKVSPDLELMRFRVKFITNGNPTETAITYPSGKVEKNESLGDYTIYEGKVACVGRLQRQGGDTSPIEIVITMQGFPKQRTY